MPDPTITHGDLMAAMWSQPLSEAALQTLKAYIAQQSARDTELTALRERLEKAEAAIVALCESISKRKPVKETEQVVKAWLEARAATDAANALEGA
jgi:hypothetical protein